MKFLDKKILIPLYVLFLLISFFYVRSVLEEDTFEISEREENSNNQKEIKPADVALEVTGIPATRTYKVRMKNTDSVTDLLNKLRDEQGFSYEIIAYTDHLEFEHVNGYLPSGCPLWQLSVKSSDTEDFVDITNEVESVELLDEAIYRFAPKCLEITNS